VVVLRGPGEYVALFAPEMLWNGEVQPVAPPEYHWYVSFPVPYLATSLSRTVWPESMTGPLGVGVEVTTSGLTVTGSYTEVRFTGGVSLSVTLTQKMYSPTDKRFEAVYVFPVAPAIGWFPGAGQAWYVPSHHW